MVEQRALRVEYTIEHSFTDRIVFGKGEIISPFPFFSALRRPKLDQPLHPPIPDYVYSITEPAIPRVNIKIQG